LVEGILAEQQVRPSEEARNLLKVKGLEHGNELLHVREIEAVEDVELVVELVCPQVEVVIVEHREAVVAGAAQEIVLLREEEAELIDDVDIPIVEAALEVAREPVREEILTEEVVDLNTDVNGNLNSNKLSDGLNFANSNNGLVIEVEVVKTVVVAKNVVKIVVVVVVVVVVVEVEVVVVVVVTVDVTITARLGAGSLLRELGLGGGRARDGRGEAVGRATEGESLSVREGRIGEWCLGSSGLRSYGGSSCFSSHGCRSGFLSTSYGCWDMTALGNKVISE